MPGRNLSLLPLACFVLTCSGFVLPPSINGVVSRTATTAASTTSLQVTTARTPGVLSSDPYEDDGTPAEDTATAATDDDANILEPQGEHHPWYSMGPLKEGGAWAGSPGAYFKEMIAKYDGAPVFKMHPGLAAIAITDHASGKWFFSQPDTVLDRQDGAYFGALQCKPQYLGDSLPALVTNLKEAHPAVRKYMQTIIEERVRSVPTAFAHATDKFYDSLRTKGLGEYTTVYDTFLQQSYAFILEFVFGTGEEGGQPLPPFEDFRTVNPLDVKPLIGLAIDTPIANGVAQAAQALQGGGLTDKQKKSMDVLLESIRSSKMWPRFTEILEEQNVPTKDLERALMFNTGFQSSVAIAKNMEYAIGALSANRDFLEELRAELDGKDLTLRSVCDEEQFPLLDSFHWEIVRMFPAPPFYVKEAKKDLLVPTSSGKKYKVKKGDMLHCHQDLVQIDPVVFGPDAREFNAKRFVGNPELKKEVFKFGYVDSTAKPVHKEGMPWGCVAHAAGVLDGILKMFYGKWVQEMDWEMTTPTIIDPDQFLGAVGPKGMSFAKITPRK